MSFDHLASRADGAAALPPEQLRAAVVPAQVQPSHTLSHLLTHLLTPSHTLSLPLTPSHAHIQSEECAPPGAASRGSGTCPHPRSVRAKGRSQPPIQPKPERLVCYCRTTSASTAPGTSRKKKRAEGVLALGLDGVQEDPKGLGCRE